MDGSERLRLFCGLSPARRRRRPPRRRGSCASCRTGGSSRPRTCTSRWRSSARRRPATLAAIAAALRAAVRRFRGTASPAPPRLPGDAERRDAHLRRRGRPRDGASPGGSTSALEELGLYRREDAALARAPHRAPLPGAAAAPAAAPRARRRSFRPMPLFSFPGCARSGRSLRGLSKRAARAPTRRLMRLDREQALETALGQIERNFGKGAVMRMSDQAQVSVGAISTGSLAARPRARHRRAAARPRRRDLRPRVVGKDDPRLPRDRRGAAPAAASAPSSTPSTRWTRPTPSRSASTSTSCSSRSPTPASRRSRSPSSSSARARSRWSRSTRSPR